MVFVTHIVPASTARNLAETVLPAVVKASQKHEIITVTEVAAHVGCTDLGTFAHWPEAEQVYIDLVASGYTHAAARDSAGKFLGRVLRYVLDTYFVYERLDPVFRKTRYRVKGLQLAANANAS